MISGEEASEWLGRELEGERSISSLAGQEMAEECIDFWEERGLIERLTEGSREALVFAHAGLGEYAAARYASRLDSEDNQQAQRPTEGAEHDTDTLRDWPGGVGARRRPWWRRVFGG